MDDRHVVLSVLAAYEVDCRPLAIEPLGAAGGFSGAAFWRITAERGALCLRRWPQEHPSRRRLKFIHDVLRYAQRQGFRQLPLPLAARGGGSFVEHGGYRWELAPWMPGQANYCEAPSLVKLHAALETLARFHEAVAAFRTAGPASGISPGVATRREMLGRMRAGGARRLQGAIRADLWPELMPRAQRWLEAFELLAGPVAEGLERAARLVVPLQVCLRDVWSGHVLFVGSQVTSLVDFGAMRAESVAADIARLLGSMVGNDRWAWNEGLTAYESVRPLTSEEKLLTCQWHRSGTLLAVAHWLHWIYVEGRSFENGPAVLRRIDRLLEQLEDPHAGPRP